MIQHEVEKFLAELGGRNVRDDVKRIGNLILANIDALAPLGTNHGQRSKEIVKIAQRGFEGASAALTVVERSSGSHEFEFKQLAHLDVGPFRGFSELEIFDLDGRIVLLYGPNGSGKTSFCEALEYALLGEIQEAEAKRLGQNEYLENARVGTYRTPQLVAKDSQGKRVEIVPDPEKYRFCFVEKNRIDDFSRIAAKTPAHQNKLIATLFGLGPFDEFVKGFNPKIDDYIDTVGEKALELSRKRESLRVDEATMKSADIERNRLAEKEQELADNVNKGMPFAEFVQYLGAPESPGRIQKLEKILEGEVQKAVGISKKSLEDQKKRAVLAAKQIHETTKEYDSKRNEVSFRDLYNSVINLQDTHPETCPACDTPILSVARNPYDRAIAGLQNLAHLSQLEQSLSEARRNGAESSRQLYSTVQDILTYARKANFLSEFVEQVSSSIPVISNQLDSQWWDVLNKLVDNTESVVMVGWEILENISEKIEKHDTDVAIVAGQREQCRQELGRLRGFRESVIKLQENRKLLEERVSKAKQAIEQFDEQNKALITAVEIEKSKVELNKRIVSAYQDLVSYLLQYRKDIPSRLLANLGETTKVLYNGFNRADPPGDLISDLRLPLASGKKIEVAYKSNPKKYFDALHVMSEGHIRCLGLAILLAKNIDLKCPVLMFDDPVNAIDDDHREGIRKTLFEDDHFSNTQIILTCHGEEFYKDIQNLIGRDEFKNGRFYSFMPHDGDYRIKIDSETTPRNYVVSAENNLAKGNIRYALADSRRALEILANRIWNFLSKNDKGVLSIILRRPKMSPELRNLADQLRSKLNDKTFVHPKKDRLLVGLESLLSKENTKEWDYLNKGTHDEEDRIEFDRATVRSIVESLVSIDSALTEKV